MKAHLKMAKRTVLVKLRIQTTLTMMEIGSMMLLTVKEYSTMLTVTDMRGSGQTVMRMETGFSHLLKGIFTRVN